MLKTLENGGKESLRINIFEANMKLQAKIDLVKLLTNTVFIYPDEFYVSLLDNEVYNFEVMDITSFPLIQAVGKGSDMMSKPAVLAFNYIPDPNHKYDAIVIGKGVIYDTGGLDIKTGRGMYGMHTDKAGAAAVAAVLGDKNRHSNILGLVGIVENSIGPRSIRPGEVVRTATGKTVEITNTDAEGRLVMGDILDNLSLITPVSLLNEVPIFTIATLTGSMKSCLGSQYAGILSTNSSVPGWAIKYSEKYKVWPLPWNSSLEDGHKSFRNADLANYNYNRSEKLDHIQAFMFLKEFLPKDYNNYTHIDIAGMATDKYWNSTGYGVELLDKLIRSIH